jgi:uncharacterized membrane protein YqgA involved in biofilm formation
VYWNNAYVAEIEKRLYNVKTKTQKKQNKISGIPESSVTIQVLFLGGGIIQI